MNELAHYDSFMFLTLSFYQILNISCYLWVLFFRFYLDIITYMCLGNLFKVEWDFCVWLHFVLFISETVKLCIIVNMSKGLFIKH